MDFSHIPKFEILGCDMDDDVGNNLNICNLSNFKIFLAEELMISRNHVVCPISIRSVATYSSSYHTQWSFDPIPNASQVNLTLLFKS
jgi:hypothetical protein